MAQPTHDDRIRELLRAGILKVDPASGNVWYRNRLAQSHQGRYLRVYLGETNRHALVHRVVWLAANRNIPADMEINHKNGDRRDNRIDNLEVVTHRDNVRKHFQGDADWHLRPALLADASPELVERALALQASNPSRTEIMDFMDAWREQAAS